MRHTTSRTKITGPGNDVETHDKFVSIENTFLCVSFSLIIKSLAKRMSEAISGDYKRYLW